MTNGRIDSLSSRTRGFALGPVRADRPPPNLRDVSMSDANFLLLATRWRTRAEEILAQAEAVTDADARQEMRETAAA